MKSIITAIVSFVLGAAVFFFYQKNQMISPSLFVQTTPESAHLMSAKYRMDAGLCGDTSTCTNYTGIFELGTATLNDIPKAIQQIENNLRKDSVQTMPNYYRFFMAEDENKKTKLILVPLDPNKNEYDNVQYICTLEGNIPCPLMCDLSTSEIFWGVDSKNKNCCK